MAAEPAWIIRSPDIGGVEPFGAIAVDPETGRFIAVGENGVVLHSIGGHHWRPGEGSGRRLYDIIRADGGFVAVGGSGKMLIFSDDGRRSAPSFSGTTRTLNGIARGGSTYVAVGDAGTIVRTTQRSAASGWQRITTPVDGKLNSVVWTGSYWIAVGDDGLVLRSSSGTSWSEVAGPGSADLLEIESDGSHVVATTGRGVYRGSRSGSDWERGSGFAYPCQDIDWDGGRWLAACEKGTIYTSVDGLDWQALERATGTDLKGIAGTVGGLAVAVGPDVVMRSGGASSPWRRVYGLPRADTPIQNLNGRFMFGAIGGTVCWSEDGIDWKEVVVQETPEAPAFGTRQSWAGLAWTGSRYVAAGPFELYSSPDGIEWEVNSDSGGSGFRFQGISWDGGVGLAVGSNGLLQSSDDGVGWVSQDVGSTTEDLFEAVWTGAVWLAIGGSRIYSSVDRQHWTEREYRPGGIFKDLLWTGQEAIAVGLNGLLLRSVDGGLAWEQAGISDGLAPSLGSVLVHDGRLFAYGFHLLTPDRVLLVSDDGGRNWTRHPFLAEPDLLGRDPADGHVQRFDSEHWQFAGDQVFPLGKKNAGYRGLYGVHWDGELAIAVGTGGTIRSSRDGRFWSWHEPPGDHSLLDITKSDDTWIAVGSNGAVLSSTDGKTWHARESGTTANLNAVCWTGDAFVAVGRGGVVLRSTDAMIWTPQASGVTGDLVDVAASSERIVAMIAFSNQVATSADGVVWTTAATPGSSPTGVVWSGSQFVTCGGGTGDGSIMQSVDGIEWQLGKPNSIYGSGIGWNGEEFVIVGSAAWHSIDGVNWDSTNLGTTQAPADVVWMGSQWVAVGADGAIVSAGDYSSWVHLEGVAPARAALTDDPNVDGITNLEAFAFLVPAGGAIDPALRRDCLPHLELVQQAPRDARWELIFTRHRSVPAGLCYTIEESADGLSWRSLATLSSESPWPAVLDVRQFGAIGSDELEVGFPIDFSSGPRLWRLRVSR